MAPGYTDEESAAGGEPGGGSISHEENRSDIVKQKIVSP